MPILLSNRFQSERSAVAKQLTTAKKKTRQQKAKPIKRRNFSPSMAQHQQIEPYRHPYQCRIVLLTLLHIIRRVTQDKVCKMTWQEGGSFTTKIRDNFTIFSCHDVHRLSASKLPYVLVEFFKSFKLNFNGKVPFWANFVVNFSLCPTITKKI